MNAEFLSQHMFSKQQVTLNPHKGSPLPADKAAEILVKASQLGAQVGFKWIFVDRPVGMFLCVYQVQKKI